MLKKVAEFMAETFVQLWNMLSNGGYIGLWLLLYPILRKLASIMKQFTS